MEKLPAIAEKIHLNFEATTQARDKALTCARQLTRESAQAIRAIHRNEVDLANEHLANGKALTTAFNNDLQEYPGLFYAGYTQDAIKEFVEATVTIALVQNLPLPDPNDLGVDYATYLKGLAEVPGELRRRCLDLLRQGYSPEVERLLGCMDEIYAVLGDHGLSGCNHIWSAPHDRPGTRNFGTYAWGYDRQFAGRTINQRNGQPAQKIN